MISFLTIFNINNDKFDKYYIITRYLRLNMVNILVLIAHN